MHNASTFDDPVPATTPARHRTARHRPAGHAPRPDRHRAAARAASAGSPQGSGRFPLTVDSIMRGPALVGYPPSGLRWSGDGTRLYFEWQARDEDESATWVVAADGSGLRRLSDEDRRLAPPVVGAMGSRPPAGPERGPRRHRPARHGCRHSDRADAHDRRRVVAAMGTRRDPRHVRARRRAVPAAPDRWRHPADRRIRAENARSEEDRQPGGADRRGDRRCSRTRARRSGSASGTRRAARRRRSPSSNCGPARPPRICNSMPPASTCGPWSPNAPNRPRPRMSPITSPKPATSATCPGGPRSATSRTR